VVDLGELGPVRCGRCKAYMNPYMRWTDGGKTYVCNFCGQANPCPDVYFNYLGPDNR
jgi:protein transport protein SEC24